jgi:RNA polymerase sigma-70 factor (ECF subfamily)
VPPLETVAADRLRSPLPRLIRLDHRTFGFITEAENIVQADWLRSHKAGRSAVRDPATYLSQMVTRLCPDHPKSARVRRETFIGPSLPEPVFETEDSPRNF